MNPSDSKDILKSSALLVSAFPGADTVECTYFKGGFTMKVLTQAQAAKEFTDRDYATFDKMLLVTGTRKEFKSIKIEKHGTITVKGKKIQVFPDVSTREDGRVDLFGTQLDVDRDKDMRLVVWL